MQPTSLAEQLFFVTVRLDARDRHGKGWTGTGFVYGVETDGGTAHFLITNRHVLDGAVELDVNMIRTNPERTGPQLGQRTHVAISGFGPHAWRGHPSAEVDVAAMPMSSVVQEMVSAGAPPFYKQVGRDMFLTPQKANELDAVEDVVFVGYPSGIYDHVNLLPVMRRGMTATPVAVDYAGVPSFLIDAAVYPGSSGSPVFIMNQGVYQPKTGGLVFGPPRLILLGVLAAVHVRNVAAPVLELPTRYVVEFQEPIGLGIVYKAQAIEDCVAPQLEEAGIRVSEDPAQSLETVPELSDADQRLEVESSPDQ